MKKKLFSYYLVLVLISLGFVTHTIFVGSLHIHYGRQIRQLSIKKENLIQIKETLTHQLAQESTSYQIQEFASENGFEPIKNVIYLEASPAGQTQN